MPFGHFLLGSHNFMVTALGSCVKWPLAAIRKLDAYRRLLVAWAENNYF